MRRPQAQAAVPAGYTDVMRFDNAAHKYVFGIFTYRK